MCQSTLVAESYRNFAGATSSVHNGAYQKVSHELIISTNEMAKNWDLSDTLLDGFIAPGQDEIDRVLLED